MKNLKDIYLYPELRTKIKEFKEMLNQDKKSYNSKFFDSISWMPKRKRQIMAKKIFNRLLNANKQNNSLFANYMKAHEKIKNILYNKEDANSLSINDIEPILSKISTLYEKTIRITKIKDKRSIIYKYEFSNVKVIVVSRYKTISYSRRYSYTKMRRLIFFPDDIGEYTILNIKANVLTNLNNAKNYDDFFKYIKSKLKVKFLVNNIGLSLEKDEKAIPKYEINSLKEIKKLDIKNSDIVKFNNKLYKIIKLEVDVISFIYFY